MKSDVRFWLLQRLTAVFLVPFIIYLLFSGVYSIKYFGVVHLVNTHTFSLSAFFLAAIYHGALGVQVILEDYVSCLRLKVVLLFLTYAASLMTALAIFLIAVKSLI